MRTLNTNWLTAFSGAATVSLILEIDLGGGDVRSFGFNTPQSFGHYESIADLTALSTMLDPITGRNSIGSIEVIFNDDQVMRDLVKAVRLRNKLATLKIGTPGLVEGDYETAFVGIIKEVVPEPGRHNMQIEDFRGYIKQRKITAASLNQHPVEFLESVLLAADVPTAQINSDSFDPSKFTDSISHFNLNVAHGSYGWPAIFQPTSVSDIVDDLAPILNGAVIMRDDGVFEFRRFNPAAAVLDLWTRDDIVEFGQKTLYNRTLNQVVVEFNKKFPLPQLRSQVLAPLSDQVFVLGSPREETQVEEALKEAFPGEFSTALVRNNTTSQTDYALPGVASQILNRDIETRFVNAFGILSEDIDDFSTFIEVDFAVGFSGLSGFTYPPPAVPTDRQVTAARPAFLRIDDEIIKCDGITFTDSWTALPNWFEDQWYSSLDFTSFPDNIAYRVRFTIAQREVLDTTKADHNSYNTADQDRDSSGMVFDYTIPELLSRELLDRFSDGAPVISVTTNLSKFALQLDDTIEIEDDVYNDSPVHPATAGHDGLVDADGVKWQIIGKETDFLNGRIGWTLMRLDAGTLTVETVDLPPRSIFDPANQLQRGGQTLLDGNLFVSPQGHRVSTTGSFNLPVTGGSYKTHIGVITEPAHTLPMEASKDIYVYKFAFSGMPIAKAVTIGAGEPLRREYEIPIARVTTDATTITAVKDLRNTARFATIHIDPGVALRGELVPNSNFEHATLGPSVPPDGFDVPNGTWGTEVIEELTTVQSGGRAVRFIQTATTSDFLESRLVPAEEGDRYTVETLTRVDVAGKGMEVGLRWYDADKDFLSFSSDVFRFNGVYGRGTVVALAPTGARYLSAFARKASGTVFLGFINSLSALREFTGAALSGAFLEQPTNITLTDKEFLVNINATGAARTVTLPAASTTPGRIYHVEKSDSSTNIVTVAAAGADTIEGRPSVELICQYQGITLYSDGGTVGWNRITQPLVKTQVTATGDDSTTSSTDVLMSGMTITPGVGDYLVMFSTSVDSDLNNVTIFVALYVGGVKVGHTDRQFKRGAASADTTAGIALQAHIIGLTVAQAIEIKWRVTGTGSPIATAHARTMTLARA